MQKESSQEESTEDNLTSTTIDRLQEYGINAADINKLKSAGICTAKGLLMVTRKELLNIKGISDVKIDKMVEAAQKIESLGFFKATAPIAAHPPTPKSTYSVCSTPFLQLSLQFLYVLSFQNLHILLPSFSDSHVLNTLLMLLNQSEHRMVKKMTLFFQLLFFV